MSLTTAISKNAFKVEYMQPFVNSLKALFEEHLSGSIALGKLKLNPNNKSPFDIAGVITFTGSVIGRCVVSFPMQVAEQVCAAYLQIEPLPEGAVQDCVGELANIIVGRAKSDLARHQIVISPPTVVFGDDFTITPQKGAACISIPCECQFGPLQLDISMAKDVNL